MRAYLVTAVLVPLCAPEALTDTAVERLASSEAAYVSWLTEVEVCSVPARKTRTRELDEGDARRVLDAFRLHVGVKAYELLPVTLEAFSLADGMLGRFETSLRALDALHLACCQLFDLMLLTADDGLAESARHFGVQCVRLGLQENERRLVPQLASDGELRGRQKPGDALPTPTSSTAPP